MDRIQFINKETNESVKTLGICWKIKDNTFAIETNVKENPFTRRRILVTIGSVYNSLEIVAPFVQKERLYFKVCVDLS